MSSFALLVLSLLATSSGVSAQTSSSASTAAAASTNVAASTGSSLASYQSVAVGTSTASLSINTALPQTAASGAPSGYSIPDLSLITSGMSTQTTIGLDTTYALGATRTIGISGAPALPTALPAPANYPALDLVPPINSSFVQGLLASMDLSSVPNLNVTTGACATSPQAAADKSRCWWTCGGCTRATDVTECPTKFDWGISYDDGPSPYTPILLDYLNEHQVTTTFFVVGSRVISRPQMLQSEYMSGHQIAVHTWSHPPLTTLTNEQIVAELGWSKQVIKDTIGVTPLYMRPPYGDIDDRVRAICEKMNLTPIIWTKGNGVEFDTNDWKIAGGVATGESSLGQFDVILEQAAQIDTGFIVLEHDLYQQSVDLAVGYVLPAAIKSINASSPYNLMSIADCLGTGSQNSYAETTTNQSQLTGTTAVSSASGTQTIGGGAVSGSSSGSASGSAASSSSTAKSAASASVRVGAAQVVVALGGVAAAAALLL